MQERDTTDEPAYNRFAALHCVAERLLRRDERDGGIAPCRRGAIRLRVFAQLLSDQIDPTIALRLGRVSKDRKKCLNE